MISENSSKALYLYIINELAPVYGEKESRQMGKLLMEALFGLSFEKVLIDEKIKGDLNPMDDLKSKLDLLKKHTPIQYVLGKAHFYGREFIVTPDVLIPRQETEELVREVITDNPDGDLKILDIGTGSGCIGITLALEMRHPRITLLDVSRKAIEVAFENATKFGVEADYIIDDILTMTHFPEKYHIIVSNPPYVREGEKIWMQSNVLDHEPGQALFVSDDDPLLFYRKILGLADGGLFPGGSIYFEINEYYGDEMVKLCEKAGCSCIRLMQDIHGKDRFIKARFN